MSAGLLITHYLYQQHLILNISSMKFQDILLLAKKIAVGIIIFLIPLIIFLFGLLIVQNVLK
jgi:hypothetical protein